MRFTSNCGEPVLPTKEMNLFSIFFPFFLKKNFIIGACKIIRVFSEWVLQWNRDYKETSLCDNLIYIVLFCSHAIIDYRKWTYETNLDISCLKWK